MIQQLTASAVQHRQQFTVEFALALLRWLVGNSVDLEPLGRPFATVAVSPNLADAVAFEQGAVLSHNVVGRERRAALTDGIEKGSAVPASVRDCQRHRVG